MASSSYVDAKVIEMSKSFVSVISHQETGHGEKEVIVGREKIKVCKDYHTIPCSVHVLGSSATTKFFQGSIGVPATVFCDPTGKELSKASGALSSSQLLKEMQKTLDGVKGEKIHLMFWQTARKGQADADVALEKNDFKKAIDAYTKIGKLRIKALTQMSEEGLKRVSDLGDKLLQDALAIESVSDKKKALEKIAADFKPLAVAAAAKKELDGLK